MPSVRLIIPTYNAQPLLAQLLPCLLAQSLTPSDVLVVDSSSRDDTVAIFKAFGAQVVVIPQSEFNHGGTRRLAAELSKDNEFLVYLTQDALPCPGAVAALIDSFSLDPAIGMAYGRQLPRPNAAGIERHARLVSYPPSATQIRTLADRHRLGVRTTFCSNSFAAYRTKILDAVGGFPEDAFFGEDQITSGRMLLAGYKLAYAAKAEAVHSHGYSSIDDFKRYFDVGVYHHRNPWLLESFGKAEGEGMRFVLSELGYLARQEPASIPGALLRTALKYAGYRLGLMEHRFSNAAKTRLSLSPYYWKQVPRSAGFGTST